MPEDNEQQVADSREPIDGNADFRQALQELAKSSEAPVRDAEAQEIATPELAEKQELAPELVAEIDKVAADTAEAIVRYDTDIDKVYGEANTALVEFAKRIDAVRDLDDRKLLNDRLFGLQDTLAAYSEYIILEVDRNADSPKVAGDFKHLIGDAKQRFEGGGSQQDLANSSLDAYEQLIQIQQNRTKGAVEISSALVDQLRQAGTKLADMGGAGSDTKEFQDISAYLFDSALPAIRSGLMDTSVNARGILLSKLQDERVKLQSALDRPAR